MLDSVKEIRWLTSLFHPMDLPAYPSLSLHIFEHGDERPVRKSKIPPRLFFG